MAVLLCIILPTTDLTFVIDITDYIRGEISDFCKEFEQFMEFYRNLCRFVLNLCVENLCGEKMTDMRSGWGSYLSAKCFVSS